MEFNFRDQDILVLDSQLAFEGRLHIGAGRPVAIAGSFGGSIHAEGEVRVLKGAVAAASIEAKALVVAGTVETDQFVKVEKLMLEATGVLSAPRIQYESLEIQLGGRLVGNLHAADLTFPSVTMVKDELAHADRPTVVQEGSAKPEPLHAGARAQEPTGADAGVGTVGDAPAAANAPLGKQEEDEPPPAPLGSIEVLPFRANLPSSGSPHGPRFGVADDASHDAAQRVSA